MGCFFIISHYVTIGGDKFWVFNLLSHDLFSSWVQISCRSVVTQITNIIIAINRLFFFHQIKSHLIYFIFFTGAQTSPSKSNQTTHTRILVKNNINNSEALNKLEVCAEFSKGWGLMMRAKSSTQRCPALCINFEAD